MQTLHIDDVATGIVAIALTFGVLGTLFGLAVLGAGVLFAGGLAFAASQTIVAEPDSTFSALTYTTDQREVDRIGAVSMTLAPQMLAIKVAGRNTKAAMATKSA